MDKEIRQRYRALRAGAAPGTPITVLHIGEEQTAVASGHGVEADAVWLLAMGSRRTVADFFKHSPPTPAELETAIMAVEDEVTRARTLAAKPSSLLSSDAAIGRIAHLAGLPHGPGLVLSLEAVERQFELLTALSLGRPAASAGIPDEPAFAATLLILREFMHHLQFSALRLVVPGPAVQAPPS